MAVLNVLMWHVHGSYTTSMVQLPHRLVLPYTPDRGHFGRGRATTWEWPKTAVEVDSLDLQEEQIDVVVAQRVDEIHLAQSWTGLRPGTDVPLIYLEHNTPPAPFARHPMADRSDVLLVHVTHFNQQMWDSGTTRTIVIEHGIPDPGHIWIGDMARGAVVVNDPIRRGKFVGTDLLSRFAPVDVFGMNVHELAREGIHTFENPPQIELHSELAHRAVYIHPNRWTSLSLSLLEAMMLGMPVVAFATTEITRAVPSDAGIVSTSIAELVDGARDLMNDQELAAHCGLAARRAAIARYNIHRFVDDWDRTLRAVTGTTVIDLTDSKVTV